MAKKDMKISVLNVGSGENPLECAKNIDPDKTKPVDEIGSAEKLSAENKSIDVVVMVSPYNYSPLKSDAARILKPGGLLVVIGNAKNDFFNEVYNASYTDLNKLGFEVKSKGNAHKKLRKSRTTTGYPISPNYLKQIVLRRKSDD